MLTRWLDLDDTFSLLNAFERQMNHHFEPANRSTFARSSAFSFEDRDGVLVLTASLPGLKREELDITLEGEVLTLKATRRTAAPEGYKVVRSERSPLELHRQFELPCRVDVDAVTAELADGILTLTLPKAPEAKPRKIELNRRETPTQN